LERTEKSHQLELALNFPNLSLVAILRATLAELPAISGNQIVT
jgi:hypothetical protein